MNSANDPSNIVAFNNPQDAGGKQVGNLLDAVRQSCDRDLKALVDNMFEHVDDSLFDRAEKAENNAAQTQYFDGMREVRKKRNLAERRFLDDIRRTLSDFAATAENVASANPSSPGNADHDELSLVDDSELEESLAITSMTNKTRTRLNRDLYALNQRLAVLRGGHEVSDADNPVGPAVLCETFRQAMRELDVETSVRLIIYKLFDRYVLAGLGDLYATINGNLADAGVLPDLKHRVPGARDTGESARGTATPGAAEDEAARNATPLDEQSQNELYATLNDLLASRHETSAQGAAGEHGAVEAPALSPAELLSALGLLQNQAATQVAAGNTVADGNAGSGSTQDVAQMKQQLLQQVGQLRGDAAGSMSGADEDTIDLVGMLFEFILEDRNLPPEMQVLLARLQIPYLKAAIIDRRMFAHASHPARRLLDALAEAAKGWSEQADRDGRLHHKIHEIVDTLLEEFDDDIDIFSRLEQNLNDFLATTRKRAELSEQRVTEATRGREKLQEARRRAAQEILGRINNNDVPEPVRGILTRAWANYLVLTLLRQGEESEEFQAALGFVDDFVWSALPMQSDVDRQQLRALLPQLEQSLRHGLSTMAFQDADIESLMGQLNTLYRQQLGVDTTAAETPAAGTAGDAPVTDTMEVIATPEMAADGSADPRQTDTEATPDTAAETATSAADATAVTEPEPPTEHMERVQALQVGDWLEFAATDEATAMRAKLSWKSPITGKYLFVNRRGLKVADKTADQLAAELHAGSVEVLEELPLFDRALDAIVERLRSTQEPDDDSSTDPADDATREMPAD